MVAVSACGRTIHFEWLSQFPSHQPLVVLNTVTGDVRTWKSLYRDLAERLPIVCFDVRNRGLSTFTGRPATLNEQLEDLGALLEEAQVSHPIWVGNSAGTSLAYRAAAVFPNSAGLILLAPLFSLGMELKIRLLRSVLIETLSDASLKQFHGLCSALTYSERYLDRHPAIVPVGLARLRKLFTAESLRVVCDQTFFPEADDAALLKQVMCPTLMVLPQEERVLPRATAECVVNMLSRGRLDGVPGGHRLLEESREMTFARMGSFVERIRRDPLGLRGRIGRIRSGMMSSILRQGQRQYSDGCVQRNGLTTDGTPVRLLLRQR